MARRKKKTIRRARKLPRSTTTLKVGKRYFVGDEAVKLLAPPRRVGSVFFCDVQPIDPDGRSAYAAGCGRLKTKPR